MVNRPSRNASALSKERLLLLVGSSAAGLGDGGSDYECTTSPLECLNMAVENTPQTIVIWFGGLTEEERSVRVELARILRHNSHTRDEEVLALLDAPHRQLLKELAHADVEHVRLMNTGDIPAISISKAVENMGPQDHPARLLAPMCPYIHYSRLDNRNELTLCGAYLDRMVLGDGKLKTFCQTQEHEHCEYYLHPRCKA